MKTILVVEDEKDMREALFTKLTASGFEVVAVGDGMEALRIVKARSIDLIVLDIILPGFDGMSFYNKLKEQMPQPMPVLILTNLNTVSFPEGISTVLINTQTNLDKVVAEVRRLLQLD